MREIRNSSAKSLRPNSDLKVRYSKVPNSWPQKSCRNQSQWISRIICWRVANITSPLISKIRCWRVPKNEYQSISIICSKELQTKGAARHKVLPRKSGNQKSIRDSRWSLPPSGSSLSSPREMRTNVKTHCFGAKKRTGEPRGPTWAQNPQEPETKHSLQLIKL
jgi:hypothetical protein